MLRQRRVFDFVEFLILLEIEKILYEKGASSMPNDKKPPGGVTIFVIVMTIIVTLV